MILVFRLASLGTFPFKMNDETLKNQKLLCILIINEYIRVL